MFEIFAPIGKAVSTRCASSDGYEVIFPGTDGPFSCVGTVNVGWGVLKFCIVLGNEGLNVFGGLIVQSVKLGLVAADSKETVDFVVSFEEFTAVPRLNGV